MTNQQQVLIEALDISGARNRIVCIHAGMRSFSPRISADELIDALLAIGATLLVPTFTYEFERVPPPGAWIPQNGMAPPTHEGSQEVKVADGVGSAYTTECNDLSVYAMGALPLAVLARDGRVRGDHPLNSFAAVGPNAQQVVRGQTPEDVYAPLRVLTENDGLLLLMGTDLTSLTFVHYAELAAGRRLCIRWARRPAGIEGCRCGSCSAGFGKLAPFSRFAEKRLTVGGSAWTATPARQLLPLLTSAIRDDPAVTTCGRPACLRCRDTLAGGLEAG